MVTSLGVRLIFVLLVCTVSQLSTEPARAAAVGAILGLDRCGLGGDAPPNTEYGGGTGVLAGVLGEIALSQALALSLQPRLAQRRTTMTAADSEEASGERESELTLDYIAVPVVLKFAAVGGRTYVAGGVDIGFLTRARLSGGGLDEEDVETSFHSVDVGALVGFGLVFPVGRPQLTTELRYLQGLVNLASGAAGGAIRDLPDRFHSSGWELTVGVLFPLGAP